MRHKHQYGDKRWRCYNTSWSHAWFVIKTALFNRPAPSTFEPPPDWAVGRDHL